MKNRKSLALLIERARNEREHAARAAAQTENAKRKAEATLQTLEEYRQDYLKAGPVTRGTAFDPRLLDCHRSFTARLDVAIAEQEKVCASARDEASTASQALIVRQTRLSAFEQLDARIARQIAQLEAGRDQKHQDEIAARRAAPNTTKGDRRVD